MFFPRSIEIHGEVQSGTAFLHSIREFDYERGRAYDVSNNEGASMYRGRGERGKCVRLEFFPQPLKMCRYHVYFFPFHLIFNGRAHIRGLCATGGSYYSAALNTRGTVYLVRCRSCSNDARERSPRSCNIKISFR